VRRCYLVFYDIRNAKRLRRVHKVLKGYGEPWQFSVFFCVLREIDRVRLQTDLEDVMNLKKDQTVLIDLGAEEQNVRKGLHVIGPPLPEREDGTVTI